LHWKILIKLKKFSWLSYNIADVYELHGLDKPYTQIETTGHLIKNSQEIYTIGSNFFDTQFTSVLSINKPSNVIIDGLIDNLYGIPSNKAIIGSAYEKTMDLTFDSNFIFKIINYTYMKPQAFFSYSPSFKFSDLLLQTDQNAIVSATTYLRLTNGLLNSIDEIPIKSFMITLAIPKAETSEFICFDRKYRKLLDWNVDLSYMSDTEKILDTLHLGIIIFFDFAIASAMLICLSSLTSSMMMNIYDQTNEMGIMLALGMTTNTIKYLYILEAFILVSSSSLVGLGIGAGVGWTVSLQERIFTQQPLSITFPWTVILTIFSSSFICAIVSVLSPIKIILKQSIPALLRS